MDKYFRQKLEELSRKIGEESRSQLEAAINSQDNIRRGAAAEMKKEQRAIKGVSREAYQGMMIEGDIVSLIRAEILEKTELYHSRATIIFSNPKVNYDALAMMAQHYTDMSIQVQFNGYLFDAKSGRLWKQCYLKKGDTLEVFAQDIEGNKDRADNALHENVGRLLGEEHPHDDNISNYIRRRVTCHDRFGLHPRPISMLVRGASLYNGDVYVRNPKTGTTTNAKSILGLMILAGNENLTHAGVNIEILYEPGSRTSDSFDLIKVALKTEFTH